MPHLQTGLEALRRAAVSPLAEVGVEVDPEDPDGRGRPRRRGQLAQPVARPAVRVVVSGNQLLHGSKSKCEMGQRSSLKLAPGSIPSMAGPTIDSLTNAPTYVMPPNA